MRRTITTTIITLSFLLGLALWSVGRGAKAKAASAATSATSSFKASTAQIDITPSNNGFPRMFLAGLASRSTDNPGLGTYPGDPGLSARAIAFDDGSYGSCGGNIKVIVTADILGFTRQMRQAILMEVASRYGLPAGNLLLSATHTHNGPVLTDNLDPRVSYPGFSTDGITGSADLVIVDNYTNWLKTAIVNLIGTAINGLPTAPQVTLSYGAGTADIGTNRIGIGIEDNDVPVLAVRSVSNNSLVAVIFGYACHPVVAGIAASHNYYYHPDFPGLARASLETGNPGTMAFFIQGAAGDINPDPADIYGQGNSLATAVQNILSGGAMQPVSGSILTEVRDVTLPLNMDPNDPTHQQLRAKYDNIRNITANASWERHANQMIAQIDANTLPVNENWPVAVWHFGTNNSLVLAALGGEVVSGYALALKSQFAGELGNKLWVAAYSNEVPGYIPSTQVWDLANYEAGWSDVPDGGQFVSSFGNSQMFYGWAAPLKRGDGVTPGVEAIVLANTTSLIQNLPPAAGSTGVVITLNGANPMTVQCATGFTDPGATAVDSCAGVRPVTAAGSVNTSVPGSYTITYSANDGNGHTATRTRTVNVVDTIAPTLTLNGANPMTVQCTTGFTDPGATATDGCAGARPVTATGSVNTAVPGSYTITYTASDVAGNTATRTRTVNVVDTIAPVISCPANIIAYLPLNSTATSMNVSYTVTASDTCGSATVTTSIASGSAFPVGTTTVTATANDGRGNTSSCSFTVTVSYNFSGFFQPVDNLPTVNSVNAGQAIPVKFSLSGNKGLNIFAAGYPVSQQIACSSGSPTDDIEETVTAGASSLSYDATTDQYKYVWKTDKAWKGRCRKLVLKFNDGSTREALFQFK
jgi:hypothetical protein